MNKETNEVILSRKVSEIFTFSKVVKKKKTKMPWGLLLIVYAFERNICKLILELFEETLNRKLPEVERSFSSWF